MTAEHTACRRHITVAAIDRRHLGREWPVDTSHRGRSIPAAMAHGVGRHAPLLNQDWVHAFIYLDRIEH